MLFTSEGKMEPKMKRWMCAVSTMIVSLYPSAVVKKELNEMAKLSIFQGIYIPALSCGHDGHDCVHHNEFSL